jgi:hypothetical protein
VSTCSVSRKPNDDRNGISACDLGGRYVRRGIRKRCYQTFVEPGSDTPSSAVAVLMQWLLNGEATGAVLTMTTCHPKFSHPRAPGRARVLESSVAKAESPDGPAALEGL